jgi:hypothetical protein
VNGKTTQPGGVPGALSSTPVVTNQYSLPQGDYYFRYAGTNGSVINMVLKSLSDAGTATGADVYQATLVNFWDASKFPSMNGGSITYNASFQIAQDTRPVFQDPFIRLGWDAPINIIELTMLQRPVVPFTAGLYVLAETDDADNTKTLITVLNSVTNIYPDGFNVNNSALKVYIDPTSNPPEMFPHYKILFRRGINSVYMSLERYFTIP